MQLLQEFDGGSIKSKQIINKIKKKFVVKNWIIEKWKKLLLEWSKIFKYLTSIMLCPV